jgi:hypothetical protein
MDGPRQGFDFTSAMSALCGDVARRLAEFNHIEVEHVAFNVCQTRRDVAHGMFASLTPLRFQGGAEHRRFRGENWSVEPLCDEAGRQYLYLLSFYLPRFQNLPLEEKLTTVFHELWHISSEFNGDLRRHAGRCYAHGSSQRKYDAHMCRLAQEWLSLDPPSHLYEFLSLSFAELVSEHGRVLGNRWRSPRLIRR